MNLKDKKLPLVVGAAGVVVILLLLVFMPSRKADDGPEIISKRVKIELPEQADEAASPDMTLDGAEPAPVVQPVAPPVAAPAPVPATAREMAKAEPMPAEKKAPPAPGETRLVEAPAKKEPAPRPKAVAAEKKTAEKTKKVAEVSRRILSADKTWVLNMASFAHLPEAQTLAGKLKKAGHNAYVVRFNKDGVEWHRVRVGFFSSRDEAVKAGRTIKTRFGLDEPWATRPDKAELAAHS